MGHVALTLAGRCLRLTTERGARTPRLHLTDPPVGTGAAFERLELGHGRIALRTAEGDYLAVRPDAGMGYAIHPAPELTPAAAFEEILWPDGQVSLRSCHLTFVSAGVDGRVTVNRTSSGPLERFFPVAVPAPAVPSQRRQSSAPRATSASPSSSAWRNERMISGTA